jgi:tetrahydromethanopterin S-methyltransferase subunit E
MANKYEKASRYDLQAQRRNHRIFLDTIRQKPWKAFAICALFATCAIALFMVSAPPSPWRLKLVAALAAAVSGYFAWQGVLGLRHNRTSTRERD